MGGVNASPVCLARVGIAAPVHSSRTSQVVEQLHLQALSARNLPGRSPPARIYGNISALDLWLSRSWGEQSNSVNCVVGRMIDERAAMLGSNWISREPDFDTLRIRQIRSGGDY